MSFPTLLKNLVKGILKSILNSKINQTLLLYNKNVFVFVRIIVVMV